mmetsp:Transcript_8984/g.19464  ORF Transcript_8984/g.19464 Transcript_8984/m.19464 type:complete len:350 (-) Transcript_8984:232-1281(-)|eukprot:CAMPEP_0172567108 /NCGR_PEP_ID=MMETSP1067-20121228/114680_1 /TAXON_ID=265564 ORGANISM="Thalassiosira punctigera, Strain Tpunct2005C2" /NCGR_SAMPLE_ID=MMETSP1067 /ASSEMBLY_ACC=CAM_ASM_000444 /LENGTH=349 /DNA_ID=CAMNT_0013358383 /DNA_START=332 /DNA_END=1381 /DNA_ORIENTATION=-
MPGLAMIMTPEQDSAHLLSTSMSIDEVADRLAAMRNQESTSYRCRDYMDREINSSMCSSACSSQSPRGPCQEEIIDRDCRLKMSEWCYQVTDFCKFQRETVAIGMNYLDRFLSTSSPRAFRALQDKKEFQLVAMTTMYIAVKLFEPLAMNAGLFALISHGCYTETDVVEMEREILESLSWRVNGSTTHAFLSHLMVLLPPSAYGYDETTAMTLLDFSRFQAEIAVSDYDLSLQKPSTVALASILNSIEGIEKSLLPACSRFQFFKLIADVSGLNPFSTRVNSVRARLLELFFKNSGYVLPQIANLTPVERFSIEQKFSNKKRPLPAMSSPGCVSRSFRTEPDAFGAKCA